MKKSNTYQDLFRALEQSHTFVRTAVIDAERNMVDMATGRFPMILATEGEASDGHIISVPGIETRDKMPLLFGHRGTDVTAPVLGSVIEPVKGKKDGVRILRQTGVLNLNGDGPLSAIRRDLAQLVNDGDLNQVSFRWDAVQYTRRINLPSDHPAFIDATKVDYEDPRYWGVFFSKSRSIEGSLVAIGADPLAIVGRAQKSEDSVSRTFLRALANHIDDATGLVELTHGFEAIMAEVGKLEALGCKREEVSLMIADPDTQLGSYLVALEDGGCERFYLPVRLVDALREKDALYLRSILRASPGADPAAQADTPAPQGTEATTPEGADDQQRFKDGTIGAMDADRFFAGVNRSLETALASTLERVTGRKDRRR